MTYNFSKLHDPALPEVVMPTCEPDKKLKGQKALVTGGSSGIGRGIAIGLGEAGADVVINYRSGAEEAEAVAETIRRGGSRAYAHRCNVADEGEVEAMFARMNDEFGGIDILVANAGIGMRSPAEEMTQEQWNRVLSINLDGIWFFNQEVGKQMIERAEGGSIINMASIAGFVGVTTGNANYAASKGGVIAMTRCLAIEWAKYDIRVNAIAPTHFKTPLIAKLMEDKPEVKDYFLGNIPLGRLGEVEEIVGPTVFLASSASSMVTGHVLLVDGGHTAI